jgi:hypothetical protein
MRLVETYTTIKRNSSYIIEKRRTVQNQVRMHLISAGSHGIPIIVLSSQLPIVSVYMQKAFAGLIVLIALCTNHRYD